MVKFGLVKNSNFEKAPQHFQRQNVERIAPRYPYEPALGTSVYNQSAWAKRIVPDGPQIITKQTLEPFKQQIVQNQVLNNLEELFGGNFGRREAATQTSTQTENNIPELLHESDNEMDTDDVPSIVTPVSTNPTPREPPKSIETQTYPTTKENSMQTKLNTKDSTMQTEVDERYESMEKQLYSAQTKYAQLEKIKQAFEEQKNQVVLLQQEQNQLKAKLAQQENELITLNFEKQVSFPTQQNQMVGTIMTQQTLIDELKAEGRKIVEQLSQTEQELYRSQQLAEQLYIEGSDIKKSLDKAENILLTSTLHSKPLLIEQSRSQEDPPSPRLALTFPTNLESLQEEPIPEPTLKQKPKEKPKQTQRPPPEPPQKRKKTQKTETASKRQKTSAEETKKNHAKRVVDILPQKIAALETKLQKFRNMNYSEKKNNAEYKKLFTQQAKFRQQLDSAHTLLK
jgi:hypothetical protein